MYDPLVESYPKPWQGYPTSYWASGTKLPQDCSLKSDIDADVIIIGAGYTGLSAAYQLSRKYNMKVVVLDANEAGWGCSGRNAGFVLAGTGRLSLTQISAKWGQQVSKEVHREYKQSIDSVNRMITQGNIQCDRTTGGYLRIAHNKEQSDALKQQARNLQTLYQDKVEFLDDKTIHSEFLKSEQCYGGIYYPNSFAVNPLKLVQGYHQLATSSGANVFTNSPVIEWQNRQSKHYIRTPQGSVTSDKVIVATNGYTSKKLHPIVANRHFPVLSSVIVTRPLSTKEIESIGIRAGLMAMDTRPMKFYYRLLPDNRILFGGRGAIKGKDAEHQVYSERLVQGLISTFPSLQRISVAYFWSGWVSVSYDDYPRIWQSDDASIHYAMGYCGSGLAFATQAGKRLAQKVAGESELPALPFWQTELKKFPLAPMRRLGLRAYYRWAQLKA
jgi:glycine/D-amino acid oxidase-like deaminating enzyme